jgi:hypothetical protein
MSINHHHSELKRPIIKIRILCHLITHNKFFDSCYVIYTIGENTVIDEEGYSPQLLSI